MVAPVSHRGRELLGELFRQLELQNVIPGGVVEVV